MAICTMTKVMIAGHISEYEPFIEDLQLASLIQFVPFAPDTEHPAPSASAAKPDSRFPGSLYHDLMETRRFILEHSPPEGLLAPLLAERIPVDAEIFSGIPALFNAGDIIEARQKLMEQSALLREEREHLTEMCDILTPFRGIEVPVRSKTITPHAVIFTAACSQEIIMELSGNEHLQTEILYTGDTGVIAVIAAHRDHKDLLEDLISGPGFSLPEFPESGTSPSEQYNSVLFRIEEIDNELASCAAASAAMADKLDTVNTLLDYYDTLRARSTVFDIWATTQNTFILQGWIRTDDFPRCAEIAGEYETILLEEVTPEEAEEPPVALKTPGIFSPFQLITRLYSYPSSRSFDPSIALSFFFIIFFGLCLTDAGYGVILAIASLIALWKFQKGKDLLWIIFWGSLGTVAAGLATGGIFGDLFRSQDPFITSESLSSARDSMMFFDPMKSPMSFFRLVLLLGLVQVLAGLLIGLVSALRQREFAEALFDYGTWLLLLTAFVSVIFSTEACITLSLIAGNSPPLPGSVTDPAFVTILCVAVVIVLFSARDERSLFFRFFIGFLNLLVLSGIFSYLGDILSYIRLMALGMVTAGIGMAVNTIAFMMYDIPVAGVVLTAVVLVGGHLFNMLINILGGFVHTLRLQYVEFFSKFFTGGGKPFVPFSYSSNFITINHSGRQVWNTESASQ